MPDLWENLKAELLIQLKKCGTLLGKSRNLEATEAITFNLNGGIGKVVVRRQATQRATRAD
jgi:hypothetical protein